MRQHFPPARSTHAWRFKSHPANNLAWAGAFPTYRSSVPSCEANGLTATVTRVHPPPPNNNQRLYDSSLSSQVPPSPPTRQVDRAQSFVRNWAKRRVGPEVDPGWKGTVRLAQARPKHGVPPTDMPVSDSRSNLGATLSFDGSPSDVIKIEVFYLRWVGAGALLVMGGVVVGFHAADLVVFWVLLVLALVLVVLLVVRLLLLVFFLLLLRLLLLLLLLLRRDDAHTMMRRNSLCQAGRKLRDGYERTRRHGTAGRNGSADRFPRETFRGRHQGESEEPLPRIRLACFANCPGAQ